MILYKCVPILISKKKIANNHNILTNKLVTIFTLTNNKNKTFPNMFQIFLKKKKKKKQIITILSKHYLRVLCEMSVMR